MVKKCLFFLMVSAVVIMLQFGLNMDVAYAHANNQVTWVWPGNQFTFQPGIWYPLQVHEENPGVVSQIDFFGEWGGVWHQLGCDLSQPQNVCSTDFRSANNGFYPPAGTMVLTFHVTYDDGTVIDDPDGYRTGIYQQQDIGGRWNSPGDGEIFAPGSTVHMSADAWPGNETLPIDHIVFRGSGNWTNGAYSDICDPIYGPSIHTHFTYECDWSIPSNVHGIVTLSFDLWFSDGSNVNSPAGTITITVG